MSIINLCNYYFYKCANFREIYNDKEDELENINKEEKEKIHKETDDFMFDFENDQATEKLNKIFDKLINDRYMPYFNSSIKSYQEYYGFIKRFISDANYHKNNMTGKGNKTDTSINLYKQALQYTNELIKDLKKLIRSFDEIKNMTELNNELLSRYENHYNKLMQARIIIEDILEYNIDNFNKSENKTFFGRG